MSHLEQIKCLERPVRLHRSGFMYACCVCVCGGVVHESIVKCSLALLKSHAAHRSLLFPMTWPRSTVFRCFSFLSQSKNKVFPQKVPLVCSRSSMFAQSFRSGLSSLLLCRICPPSVCVYCSPWAFLRQLPVKAAGHVPDRSLSTF